MIKRNYKYIILQLCLFCLNACAFVDKSKIEQLSNSEMTFSQSKIDLGKLKQNNPKDTSFIFKNIGKELLVIQNVETSCGCNVPQWTKKPIGEGNTGEITITYDSKYPGRFHKTIMVYANVPNSPIQLSIDGEVTYPQSNE
jgi:hypothetical protein